MHKGKDERKVGISAEEICLILEDKKAIRPVILNVGERFPLAQQFIVASGTSERHLDTLSQALERECKDRGFLASVQGRGVERQWIVLDLGPIWVHLFLEDWRKHYDLEALWTGKAEETCR